MGQENLQLPEIGEIIVGTIKQVASYGVYITLDEFNNIEGFLHISEVSSGWVKNIRNYVRENQKTVLKVLRVDSQKLHVDLSLRRVTDRERKEKLQSFKQERRGKEFLKMFAEKVKMTPEEAYNQIGIKLEDDFGSIYKAFEMLVDFGEKSWDNIKVTNEWMSIFKEIAFEKIHASRVKIKGILELTCLKRDGVNILKNAFIKGKGIKKPDNVDLKIYVIGSPKYCIEVSAPDYKTAEKVLEEAVSTSIKIVSTNGGAGNFLRT